MGRPLVPCSSSLRQQFRRETGILPYEKGALDVDERLVTDLIVACRKVADKIKELPPIQHKSK